MGVTDLERARKGEKIDLTSFEFPKQAGPVFYWMGIQNDSDAFGSIVLPVEFQKRLPCSS